MKEPSPTDLTAITECVPIVHRSFIDLLTDFFQTDSEALPSVQGPSSETLDQWTTFPDYQSPNTLRRISDYLLLKMIKQIIAELTS